MTTQIKCPHCKKLFEPTEAYKHEFEEKLLKKEQAKHQEKIERLSKEKIELEKMRVVELKEVKRQVAETTRLETEKKAEQKFNGVIEATKKEAETNAKQNLRLKEDLEEQAKVLSELKEDRNKSRKAHEQELKEIEDQITKKAKLEAQESVTKELKDKEDQIAGLKKRAEQAEEQELKIRKEKREFEESKRKFELEKQRQLDSERGKIRDNALKEAQEKHELKDKEKAEQLRAALKTNEELRRKLQQGSQQTQGEVLELELEEILKKEFPLDNITEVKKGQRGADVIQEVINKRGRSCGVILWELKNARWQNAWVSKLKEDQRQAKAHLAILVVAEPPEDLKSYTYEKGIWVTTRKMIVPLALTLRFNLINLYHKQQVSVGKNQKMEILYQYITSVEFSHRIQAILETFGEFQEGMEKEKRLSQIKWARQEKQLRKMIDHTTGMYGDLQGVVGKSLPEIKTLKLESGEK